MRRGSSLPAALAALIVSAAHAEGTTTTTGAGAGSSCYFLGPKFGADVLDIGWVNSVSNPGVLPGLRAGLWLANGFLAAEAGLKIQTSPGSGYGALSLDVGGLYGLGLGKWGSLQTYGLGGLDVNLQAGVSGGSGYAFPNYGLTLGLGLQYPVTSTWTLGGEVGLHTVGDIGPSSISLETGLFVSVVGSWSPPGPCSDHPTTISRDGPMVPPDEPTVSLVPPPIISTHHDSYTTPCSVYVNDGWMEPTQDVWQDDISFEDKPGKQLTRLDGDAVAYLAELPMATHKATLLFGAHHYLRFGAPVQVDSRDFIVLSGMTNCTTPKPVKLRFTLESGGPGSELWTSPEIGQVKLAGPGQREYEPWSVRLPVRQGVPPDRVFTIDNPGPYHIRAELLDEGNPTGLMMTLGGQAQAMSGPVVHFVPVMLTKADAAGEGSLITLTEILADFSRDRIPDVFPLAPGGLPTTTHVIRNLVDAQVPDRWFESRRISYLVAALNDTLAASTFLEGGGRVVAVMTGADFKSVFGTGAAGMTVSESVSVRARGQSARTLSWKVMLVPSYESWDTVAHEILHTMPEGWAEDEMQAECNKAYHNKDEPLAHGEKITEDSIPTTRDRKVAMVSLMGPSIGTSKVWIDQCTYWHLTKMLAGGPPDPPVTLLRALIGKKGGKPIGELRPVYEMGGSADLKPGKASKAQPYAFVFKSAQGAELARFPFNPRATDIETRAPLEVMSFVARAPLVHGWAQLELQGPGGAVLDRKVRAEAPPEVVITAPQDGAMVTPGAGNKVKVTWTAKGGGAAPAPVLCSVLYSSDGGKIWADQAFEQPVSELEVALSPKATEHLVKVAATDGTRSSEAIIRLRTTPPPAPSPAPVKK